MNTLGTSVRYAFSPPTPPTLPILGIDAQFPIHRIYCVGRNYAAHAVEMGHNPDREPPFFFQKNPDSLVLPGFDFPYPPQSTDVHYEVELVVALGAGGINIPVAKALDCVFGYGVGLDMTRRDLQETAKKAGRPWEVGKSFESSAPCSSLAPVLTVGHPTNGAIWAKVNGELRQNGDVNQMIWKVPEIVANLSELFELRAGDLIFTGTPAGVGPVKRDDVIEAGVAGVAELRVRVA